MIWKATGLAFLILSSVANARQDLAPAAKIELTQAQQRWIQEHPGIRLGPYRNYAPAQFVDDKGVHRGIAAEYVQLVEQKLGLRFDNVMTETWQELLDEAKARNIDVIAMAAETEDRLHYLSFTSPYLELDAVIIARDSVEQRLKTDDLIGMKVCVVAGYAVVAYLESNFPDLEFEQVSDTRTGLRKVSLGMSDAFISDLAVASHYIEEEKITNLRIVGETGYVYRMGFAVRNDWPELTAMIELALQEISPQQSRAIFNHWISLSHETEFASRRLTSVLIGVVSTVTLLAIGFLVWNRTLQKRVDLKTRELEDELIERRRVADELRTSEERVRMIINTALDAVVTIDERGEVTGWSKQAESMFGWPREEMIGQSIAQVIIPPQYRQAHIDGMKRFHETGEGPVLNSRIEITALHRDGHEFPIELAITPLHKTGAVEFSAFVRDITERQKNEEELRMHRVQLEELVVARTAEMREAKEAAEHAESLLAIRVKDLEQALTEVKQLRGLLPICSYCKRIREGEDYTRSVEAYFAEHSDAQFSHGVCPDCYKRYVEPELEEL